MKLILSIAGKIVLIISAILFVVAFREYLGSHNGVIAAFEELMSQIFPFYEPLSCIVAMATDTKFTYITSLSVYGIIKDIMRIMTTVLFQPLFFAAFSFTYLRLPKGFSIDALEGVMASPFYKMKEAAVLAISAPLSAFLADMLTGWLYSFVELRCYGILELLVKLALIFAVMTISVLVLCLNGVSLKHALIWRGYGTIFIKVAYTVLSFGLWMFIVFAIKQSEYIYIPIAIIVYILLICIVDIIRLLIQKVLIF